MDAGSAVRIMTVLRSLANSGLTIVCTVQRPSSEVFQRFDNLLLLSDAGKTNYFGEVGESSSSIINYLERNGGRRIGTIDNPAEYALEVISAASKQEWAVTWEHSQENLESQKSTERIHAEALAQPHADGEQESVSTT
jgi:ABC-type multidrug transport system ATPase subunit